jgi:voltage-gated potassium channel
MGHQKIHTKLSTYRYEFLLVALLLLIFDKIFFPDNSIYLKYVWPLNMLIISIASFGIFMGHGTWVKMMRNVLSTISVMMPFGFMFLAATTTWFISVLTIFYIFYYIFIFGIVMYQITKSKEVEVNVIIGSFCGYMLLSMISLFSYLTIELHFPKSFHGITYDNISIIYNEMSYFSFVTLTSIGFGDIYPITDMSRLTTAFFGMIGQFYMVAVVGIVISKFSSR